jgi:hypothetical protein
MLGKNKGAGGKEPQGAVKKEPQDAVSAGWKKFSSPFEKVAGAKALAWGLAGLAVSVVATTFSGWRANGLMQFGPGPDVAWWTHALSWLIIWLVPAAIIYGLGAALSRSRIRVIDVAGTTAFAMLPLAVANLAWLLPGLKELANTLYELTVAIRAAAATSTPLDVEAMMTPVKAVLTTPLFAVAMVVAVAAMVVTLIWMFNAVRVSCNLQGWRLWVVWLVGVIGGDAVCRLLIGLLN